MKLFGNTHSKLWEQQNDPVVEAEQDETQPASTEESAPAGEAAPVEPADGNAETPETSAELGEYDEDEEYGGDEEEETEEDVKKRKSALKKVLIVGSSLLLAVLVVCALFVNYLLELINYQAADSDYFVTVSVQEELPEETPVSELLAQKEAEDIERIKEEEQVEDLEVTPEMLAQMDKHLEDITSDSATYEVPISEDVYNILLIGTDNREEGAVGRSDAMILVSLNQKTQDIYLTSFLRDCYVKVPGYGNTRLNHAFAYGGPDLLMETLEENFKVHVDKYVAVDFFSFMDVIDIIGGVYIDVTEEEMEVANQYIWSMNELLDVEWSEDYIWNPGWQLLNGKQTLAYARDRYTGNDYARTQRQRNIINQLIKGAFSSSPSTLVDLAQVVLPQVTTDLEKSQILNYAANVMAYLNYDIQQQQIPTTGTYRNATISGMSVISLDMDENIEFLQDTIYGETEISEESAEEVSTDEESVDEE